ncbi:MAG: uracil-DNA glycosylase [Candidatus Hydrogenedentota bacterium]
MQNVLNRRYQEIMDDFIEYLKFRCAEADIKIDYHKIAEKNEELWNEFEKKIKECRDCSLYKKRNNVVPGAGSRNSKLLIVGEAPGEQEDLQGVPFVGAAGELLTKILNSIGIKRENIYITNIIKCRPPNNREPFTEEIEACNKYLQWQIDRIKPAIILALGNYAIKTLTGVKEGITKIHGEIFNYRGIPVIVSFHPAALLRNEVYKRPTWQDMQKLQQLLKEREIKI